ncbi:MAG: MFS transporter [Planctomycetota bacterium]|nr:MFS transporter [Planctomycetota bacterium]
MSHTDGEPRSRDRWLVLAAALLGWMFDGLEQGLFPLVGRDALTELIGETAGANFKVWFGVIMAFYLVGAACGGLLFGWLGDRIGRVRAMVLSIATYAIFSGLCGFSTQAWHLGALRTLSSLGMGGEWALGVALVMEIWPARYRPMLAGVIGAAANVGILLVGLMGLGLSKIIDDLGGVLLSCGMPQAWVDPLLANSGWRLILFLGATPAVLAFFIQIFVPESEKWKHAAATTPKNKVSDIFKGGLAKFAVLGALLGAVALLGTWGSVMWTPAWADKMSKAPAAVAEGWGKTATPLTQIALACGAIIGCLLSPLFAQLTSRRVGYFTLCLLSLVICQCLFRLPMELGMGFFIWIFAAGLVTASFYGWLPLYLPELFPTRVRATGQGFSFNAGRILAAGGTLGSGGLLAAFDENYAAAGAITCLVYVVGIILIWFCPETKGKPLPE